MTLTLSREWKHYGLRTSNSDGTAFNGFQWPVTGLVEAPDWNPEPICGGGLHALLGGEGNSDLLSWHAYARWQLVGFDEYVSIGGDKVKVPRCEVATGTRAEVTQAVRRLCNTAPHGLVEDAGNDSMLTGGDYSTLTCGDYSTLTGGNYSTLTGGYLSTLTGGYLSTLTGGYRSRLTGGDDSRLTGGYRSRLTGGYRSTLTFYYWHERRRAVTAYPGEGGIEPGKPYRCAEGRVVPADGDIVG